MRRQPVAFALVDAAFLADSKWRKLGRRLPDPTAFNSAIGAWLRVLTAARRNGLPDVSALEEAEDPTYLLDLIAVGLLTETGIPEKPYRAWAPARPKYPGEGGTDSTNGTSATNSTFPTQSHASTPFTSTLIPSKEGGAGGVSRPKPKDELREAQRAAYIELYGLGPFSDEPIITQPSPIPSPEDQEREILRKAALALHERFLNGEIGAGEYERLRDDIGKQPDDLTRAEA